MWVYPSSNITRCPVRIIDKYMGLCPPIVKGSAKANFYLRSLNRVTPAQWYSSRVLGINAIKKVVTTMLKDANLDGFFTNHSLRRSRTTRLFQAGLDHKLVKEFTGHASDAVDQYQITSHEQPEDVSHIISGEKDPQKTHKNADIEICDQQKEECKNNSLEISVCHKSQTNSLGCSCSPKNVDLEQTKGLGVLINDILEERKYGNAKIKIEIDLTQ